MKLLRLIAVAFLIAGCSVANMNNAIFTEFPYPSIYTPTPDLSDPEGRNSWNFVILGSDYRADDPARQSEHTDAFIIVHVEEADGVTYVTAMPIARELWIVSHETLIHSIYRKEGFEGVAAVVEEVFGLPVDAIAYANLDSFSQFVDAIDGVKLTVQDDLKDRCGDKQYNLKAGQTEVFSGHDLLCYARMRKGSENGYFDRQVRHVAILQAMWEQLRGQIVHEPTTVAHAIMEHPFIRIWPTIEWISLAKLAIRADLSDNIVVQTESLDYRFLEQGMEIGQLADGTIGEFFVQYPLTDLRIWAQCAINIECTN